MGNTAVVGAVAGVAALVGVFAWLQHEDAAMHAARGPASASEEGLVELAELVDTGPRESGATTLAAAEEPASSVAERAEVLPDTLATAPVAGVDDYELRGRVVDGSGAQLEGVEACLRFREDWVQRTRTDADGAFALVIGPDELATLPRERSLSFEVRGDPYLTMAQRYVNRDGGSELALPVAGARDDVGTLALVPAGAIAGRVIGSDGRPVAGAEIDVSEYRPDDPSSNYGYRGAVPDVRTDANGEFVLNHMSAGSVKLSANHELCLRDAGYAVVDVRVGQTTGGVLVSVERAPVVTGRVVDEDGQPLVEAIVNGTGNWSFLDTVEVDSDGRFRVGLRKGAPARVEAIVDGMKQIEPAPGVLSNAGELTIVMRPVDGDAPFRARIVDAETGALIPIAGVLAVPPDSPDLWSDGTYEGPGARVRVQPEDGLGVATSRASTSCCWLPRTTLRGWCERGRPVRQFPRRSRVKRRRTCARRHAGWRWASSGRRD